MTDQTTITDEKLDELEQVAREVIEADWVREYENPVYWDHFSEAVTPGITIALITALRQVRAELKEIQTRAAELQGMFTGLVDERDRLQDELDAARAGKGAE